MSKKEKKLENSEFFSKKSKNLRKKIGYVKKEDLPGRFDDFFCIKVFSGFKCKICLTFHINIKSFWNHIKGKKHVGNTQHYQFLLSPTPFQYQIVKKTQIEFISFSFRIFRVVMKKTEKKIIIIQFQSFYKNLNSEKLKFPQNPHLSKESLVSFFLVFPGISLKLNQIVSLYKESKFSNQKKMETKRNLFSVGYFSSK